MDLITLIGITGALAIVVFLVGALVTYMSSLVKSAYQIRVELRNDMDTTFKTINEDLEKKAKWLKRDMVEELGRVKDALQTLNTQSQQELRESVIGLLDEAKQDQAKQILEMNNTIAELRQQIQSLEQEKEARSEMARRVRDSGAKAGTPDGSTADTTDVIQKAKALQGTLNKLGSTSGPAGPLSDMPLTGGVRGNASTTPAVGTPAGPSGARAGSPPPSPMATPQAKPAEARPRPGQSGRGTSGQPNEKHATARPFEFEPHGAQPQASKKPQSQSG